MKESVKDKLKKGCVTVCWILIWQALSFLVSNEILLAGPFTTLRALWGLVLTGNFWQSAGSSLARILLGFFLGAGLGICLGSASFRWGGARDFLKPLMTVLKTVPVASFVILLLIWFGNRNISVLICMIVTLPILYYNTLEGLDATDEKLLEMCSVFRVRTGDRFRYVYFPGLYPFWMSAFKLAIGMSFKSGVAAEVIGQPLHTLGNGLYLAKIYLETGELFGWTIVIVALAAACERILLGLLKACRPGGSRLERNR